MFANACAEAGHFTMPLILSTCQQDGTCQAAIGTFVVVNEEGWALTADHVVDLAIQRGAESGAWADQERKKKDIYSASLEKRERARQLKALPVLGKDSATHSSLWLGWNGVAADQVKRLPACDVALLHLTNFDPKWVQVYPTFRESGRPNEQGTSLCRLGYPFHSVKPSYDAARNVFDLPAGTFPIPRFPNEGIFTRTVEVPPPAGQALGFPLRYVETSNPGLKGQSGGPIFDRDGLVWGIQSQTRHMSLGFTPEVPNGKPGETVHQFMNVGWGAHVDTVTGFMKREGVRFNVKA